MGLFESIADRRIREARRAGLFDNLPGVGKPIPDLGQERPPGWWANRVMKAERDEMRYQDLKKLVDSAMPALWRLESEANLTAKVGELNDLVDTYNSWTSFLRLEPLDLGEVTRTWRRLRRSGGGARAGST